MRWVGQSEDEGPKEKEKMVEVHHKLKIGSGRAKSGIMLVELPIDVAALAPVKVLFPYHALIYMVVSQVFPFAHLILMLVDPLHDVLMAFP